jgi:hypothetical protein
MNGLSELRNCTSNPTLKICDPARKIRHWLTNTIRRLRCGHRTSGSSTASACVVTPNPRRTPSSLRKRAALLDELAIVRARNHALNEEEFVVGVLGIATRVTDAAGACVAALSVAGPTARALLAQR